MPPRWRWPAGRVPRQAARVLHGCQFIGCYVKQSACCTCRANFRSILARVWRCMRAGSYGFGGALQPGCRVPAMQEHLSAVTPRLDMALPRLAVLPCRLRLRAVSPPPSCGALGGVGRAQYLFEKLALMRCFRYSAAVMSGYWPLLLWITTSSSAWQKKARL